jgi:diguanylate cyclase
MSPTAARSPVPRAARQADSDGELNIPPGLLGCVWLVLVVLTILEAAKELFGLSGPQALYETWFHNGVIVVAAALVLLRAAHERRARRAWLAIGLAMVSWGIGSVSWSIVYGTNPHPPYPTFADIFWLLWYPLVGVGIASLIRLRVHRFVLHRWLDGLALILLVLAAGVALVLQRDADHVAHGVLAMTVGFSYPVLDVLLIGAVLGVYGVLGWHPDRVWALLGLGIVATAVADATFAVQQAQGRTGDRRYDFVWTLGALLISYAAWVRAPREPGGAEQVFGLRAVALPLLAQALAAGIQIYAFILPINETERLITVVVLAIAAVQIFLARPRPASDASGRGAEAAGETRDHA